MTSNGVFAYVVATSYGEAQALAAKPEMHIADYGDAKDTLKAINSQPHQGTSYRIFTIRVPDKLDGR